MTRAESLDARYPLGALLTWLGGVLAAYGFVTRHDAATYIPSGNLNVNLGWGAVMLMLGVLLLALGARASRASRASRVEHGAAETTETTA